MARASEWPAEAAGRSDGGADLTARVAALLESAGPDFLPRQRWFGSKAHRITGLRVVDLTPFSIAPDVAWLLAIIQVRYEDQPDEQYFVPVGVRSAQDLAAPIESGGSEILGVLPGGQTDRIVFDATVDPDFCRLLIRRLQRPQPVVGPGGSYAFRRVEAADPGGPTDAELPLASVERVRAEQSNTSVIYDRRLILKAFRRLAPGLNPDVEIGRFLTTATTFRNVPRVYGYFEYTGTAFEGSLGVVQDFVASRGDGWRYTLDCLEELRRRTLGTAAPAAAGPLGEWLGDYFRAIFRLGAVTGQLHRALASGSDPAFAPEPITAADLDAWSAAIAGSLTENFGQLRRLGQNLPPALRQRAAEALAREAALRDRIGALRDQVEPGLVKTRYHGDYHLGQVLWTGEDFVILDFEGEPARPLEQRRAKQSPLKDVAGMLRSFDYAAATAALTAGAGAAAPPDWSEWLRLWQDRTAAEYLAGYLAEAERSPVPFVPRDPGRRRAWIEAFAMEKAIYELGYELNNRPDWVPIPLLALGR